MQWNVLLAFALVAPSYALIRFGCSQLVVDRLDPLVNPGVTPSPHLHQIIGGNSFNASMDPADHDLAKLSTCTTCQPADDFSNYWTASLYFRSRNGTYKRVPQKGNVMFEGQHGGMTVYYMQDSLGDFQQKSKVKAFQPGFRMLVGSALASTKPEADKFPQLTYTCLQDMNTRFPETKDFPQKPCPAGIMVNVRFPTCWDGVNLDSPDHMAHVSYPANGTFENQGPCPSSHPVRIPQILYEVIFETKEFNTKEQWPADGSQPFEWSFSDRTGYGNHGKPPIRITAIIYLHMFSTRPNPSCNTKNADYALKILGDYVFGWKDDALQKILDEECYVNCQTMRTQSIEEMNKCSVPVTVKEDIGDTNFIAAIPGQKSPML